MSWLALLSFSLFQLKTLSASTPSENRHYFDSSGSGTQEFAEFILSGQVPTETRQFASSSGSSEKRQYVSSGGLGTTESVKGLYGYNGAYGKGTAAGYALTTSSLYCMFITVSVNCGVCTVFLRCEAFWLRVFDEVVLLTKFQILVKEWCANLGLWSLTTRSTTFFFTTTSLGYYTQVWRS